MSDTGENRENAEGAEKADRADDAESIEAGQVGPVEPMGATVALPDRTPAGRPVRRGRAAAVAGGVLLAAALVAGIGFTVVTVDGADRDAGAPTWKFPAQKKDAEVRKPSGTGLAAMLVPYGTDGFSRGPDIGRYGADADLSGREATALRKESLRDLPRSQRLRLERQVDKEHIKGMALRSYLSTSEAGGSTAYADRAFTMEITLARLQSRAAVRDISSFQNAFLDALGVFRKGPSIKGHKNAHCFLTPKKADEKLDSMFCSAYEGDVLVTATASAARPLDTKSAAFLLRTQLDRITDPGEAV